MEFELVDLLLVLFLAWISGALATRIGYPAILGELAAGILFGPAVLGWLQPNTGLTVLAEVGIYLMMLYIGMEIDPRELARAGARGLAAATGGMLLPFLLGFTVTHYLFGRPLEAALFLGLAMAVTSLATKSRILIDLDLLGTRIANVLVAAALVADTAILIAFAAIISLIEAGTALGTILLVLAKAVAFFGVTALLGLKLFPVVGQYMQRIGFTERTANFTILMLVGLVFAELAELAGLHAIIGAFMAGLFLREGVLQHKLSHELAEIVRDLSIGFLAPIFFVLAGFHVSLSVFVTSLPLLLLIIGLATVGKILGAALLYRVAGGTLREGLVIGAGMNGHGAVEIVLAQIALEKGLIDQEIFSILILMAFFTTATVPILLKLGVAMLRRRGELAPAADRPAVLIVGAGPTARTLGLALARDHEVHHVDANPANCAAARALGLDAVQGDALRAEVLEEARAGAAKTVIAMTPNPQINVFVAQLAREEFLVPEIFVLSDVAERDARAELAATLKVHTFDLGAYPLLDWDRWLAHQQAEPVELEVSETEIDPELWLDHVHRERPFLPLVVERNGQTHFFYELERLRAGDRVHGVSPRATQRIQDEFDRLVAEAPILDLDQAIGFEACFWAAAEAVAPRLEVSPTLVAERLVERERADSTVVANGIAIPHALVPGEGKFALVVVRDRAGVTMLHTERPVYAVFVLVGTRDRRGQHLRTLSAIAQIVQQEGFESRWIAARDTDEIRRLLLEAKRKRFDETFF